MRLAIELLKLLALFLPNMSRKSSERNFSQNLIVSWRAMARIFRAPTLVTTIGFGRGECILLRRRLGIERVDRVRDRPPTLESDLDPKLRGVGVRAPPEEVIALSERLFHQVAHRLGFGTIFRECLINQQRPRRHGFEFGLLHREERVGVADKGT